MGFTSKPTLDEPGDKVISPVKLAHVVLRTNNFDEMRAYWKTFLGGHASFENDFFSLITYDEEHHRLAVMAVSGTGPKNQQTCGLEHVAFTYSSLESLALAYLQRQKHGIEPFWCINHGPTTSLYYKDPDGNQIEAQVDNLTTEEAIAFVEGEAYRINPIGVDFKMEDLIRRLKSGEPECDIMHRPESGPRGLEDVPH